MGAQFFINDESMGDTAKKHDALRMIVALQDLGWPVAYGDPLMNKCTETEDVLFDKAFVAILNKKQWMVLRSDVYGYEAVRESERTDSNVAPVATKKIVAQPGDWREWAPEGEWSN